MMERICLLPSALCSDSRHIIFIIETVIRGVQNFKSRVMTLGRLNSQANNSMDTPASWSELEPGTPDYSIAVISC